MKKQEKNPPLGNPATGEVPVVLADGKTYLMRFDLDALEILEQTLGGDLGSISRLGFSVTHLQAFVFAGCWRDAREQRVAWTIAEVHQRIPLRGAFRLWRCAQWALHAALDSTLEDDTGEAPAAAVSGGPGAMPPR